MKVIFILLLLAGILSCSPPVKVQFQNPCVNQCEDPLCNEKKQSCVSEDKVFIGPIMEVRF